MAEWEHAPEREALIDSIYEIASEPAHLDTFIDAWDREGRFAELLAKGDLGQHLDRAAAFLARLEPEVCDLSTVLAAYARFAAFIVDDSCQVLAANAGAEAAFGLTAGHPLGKADLPEEVIARVRRILGQMVTEKGDQHALLRLDLGKSDGAALMRVQRVAGLDAVLIVTTHFQWSATSDALLAEAYGLTQAECDVVRLLVEGRGAKAVAAARGTTEGTTRGQIKSIIAKMNVRSQADIVRVAVMLGDMPGNAAPKPQAPSVRKDWLQQAVWAPFKTVTLPDGRVQQYHEMGPADGNPVLLSHLGSCMVRWSVPMLRLAHAHQLRVICPIRAGYGASTLPSGPYDPFELTTQDTLALLDRLGIARLPYVVQGSDFPLAAHFVGTQTQRVSHLISVGGRPCLPGGAQVEGRGAWQRFFLSAARSAPKVTEFAAAAVMAMSRRIGPTAMLRQLCKDSPADLALLEAEDIAPVLEANVAMMSDKASQSGRAFAHEYIAFQRDWSGFVRAFEHVPTHVTLANEDPTFDLSALPALHRAYPWITFEVAENAGLALMYQAFDSLIPRMADAARFARAAPVR